MSLRHAAVFSFLSAVQVTATASDEQRFIGVECDQRAEFLRISYHSSRVHANFQEGYLVDTFHLKKNDASGERVESIREVVKACKIKGTNYQVRLRAAPGNFNLTGECGGETYGAVKVFAGSKAIEAIQFEKCLGTEVVTTLTFEHGATSPKVLSTSAAQFR